MDFYYILTKQGEILKFYKHVYRILLDYVTKIMNDKYRGRKAPLWWNIF